MYKLVFDKNCYVEALKTQNGPLRFIKNSEPVSDESTGKLQIHYSQPPILME